MKKIKILSIIFILLFYVILGKVNVFAAVSIAPIPENIVVHSNIGYEPDELVISNLSVGDIVRVYPTQVSTTPIAVEVAKSDTVTLFFNQLGKTGTKLYVSVTNVGNTESSKTQIEPVPEETTFPPSIDTITVTNNLTGKLDTIVITRPIASGIQQGDIIKVYTTKTALQPIAVGKMGATEATIYINQLGKSVGKLYISLTSKDNVSHESSRVEVSYDGEPTSTALNDLNVTVINNVTGINDLITVNGLQEDDVIKVYNARTGGTELGSATVGSGETQVNISVPQLGINAGKIYISVTSNGMLESARLTKDFLAEPVSTPPNKEAITIINNYTGTNDSIIVTGLVQADIVKVYNVASGGTEIGSATVGAGENSINISIEQLGVNKGTIYLSVTSVNKLESTRTAKDFDKEPTSTEVAENNIEIINNKAGMDDIIRVTGLTEGDTIKVYRTAKGGTEILAGTVGAGETSVIMSIEQLGSNPGKIYVAVCSVGKQESIRMLKAYSSELSTTPTKAMITIVNNYVGTDDTITVTDLEEGDMINIYNVAKEGEAIASATVGADESVVNISIPQIGSGKGILYISKTSENKLESSRIGIPYMSEPTSSSVLSNSITVHNNKAGINDIVTITDLSEGDIVKIYNVANGGVEIATATVGEGENSVNISIPQLGTSAGKIYVSVTTNGKLESTRTLKQYLSEISMPLTVSKIIVTNNYIGTDDVVRITGLLEGDTIKIYNARIEGDVIATATVGEGETNVDISIPQLGSSQGIIYVSVTNLNKEESTRVSKTYNSEPTTVAPPSNHIIVVNNYMGTNDTVTVNGVAEGDIVKIYGSPEGGTEVGAAIVGVGETTATISLVQLGTSSGKIYVTLTSPNKLESKRVAKTYASEPISTAPLAADITVINNYLGTDDVITVKSLTEGDLVKVYGAPIGGIILGTATVEPGETEVTITVPQIGVSQGTIFVSKTSPNKLESVRTAKTYSAPK